MMLLLEESRRVLANDGKFQKNAAEGKTYIPRTQLTSIFEGQPSKTRPFPIKTRVIWVLGTHSLQIPIIQKKNGDRKIMEKTLANHLDGLDLLVVIFF